MPDPTGALATSGSAGGAASASTASFTRTAGKWYYAIILNETDPADTANHATISGWAEDKYIADPSDRNILGMTVLKFLGDGSSGALTIAFGGVSQVFFDWQIVEFSDVGATPQVQSNSSFGTAGGPATTLAAFADAVHNTTFFAAAKWFTAITAEAGYTPISTDTGDVPMLTSYKIGQDTTPSGSATGGDDWVAFAAEIASAAAGGNNTQTPTGLSSTMQLGTPTVVRVSNPTLHPTGLAATMALGTPSLSLWQVLKPTGFSAPLSLGTPSVSTGSNPTMTPTGFSAPYSLGTFTIQQDTTLTGIAGFSAPMSLGTPTVSKTSNPTVQPSGLSATMQLGVPSVQKTGSPTITPAGFSATMTLGSPTLVRVSNPTVAPAGLAALMQLGTPTLQRVSNPTVTPLGLASLMALGFPTIQRTGNPTVTPAGLSALMTLGTPMVLIFGGSDVEIYFPARFTLDDPTLSLELDDPSVSFTFISAGRIVRSRTYKIRPNDTGRTYRGTLRHAGFKNLANLDGYSLFGCFVNVATDVRDYDSLAGTIIEFDGTEGTAEVECAAPSGPVAEAKYRLEFTLTAPSGKTITGPSPDMPQTFIECVTHG